MSTRRPKLLVTSCIAVAVTATVTVLLLRSDGPGLQLSTDQRTVIDRLESVLLHDSVVPQYGRVVNEFDQRGYAAGIGDFSTAGGEALEVIHVYTARNGANELSRKYSTPLSTLAEAHSDDVAGLDGFTEAWQLASVDPSFRQAQSDVLHERYFTPALLQARELGIGTPLGLAVIYDSLIQHGSGGPDGLLALLRQAETKSGGTPKKIGERRWLEAFLEVRRSTLADPSEPAHQEVWPYEVGRVDALISLLKDGHDQLVPPLVVAPYGTPRVIDLSPFDLIPSLAMPSMPGGGTTSGRPGGPGRSAGPTSSGQPRPSTSAGAPTTGNPSVRRQGPVVGLAGLCLDLDGGVGAAGNHVKTWTCNGTDAQLWTAETDGTLRVVAMCAQPRDDSPSPGAPVEIDPCDGRGSQQWRFTGGRLVNSASGLCLSITGDSSKPGAFVQLMTCNGAAGQRWAAPGAA
ncbi:chitosanase [Dactylosporangium sp. AC04546]|uniref:chitosanase n=1 Tax=Dactylosporangium sp. AC04546 TaxID=2862460 RepID=UPI002E7AD1B2|nr:chitosanase [Dactylosporangium sp. AC04546]WVK86703.1 chitosanase [Dactylosporangium sp. AC04546]